MDENFDAWNLRKKQLEKAESRRLFKERDIWWCALGHNIGDETQGKGAYFTRPVLVYRKFNAHLFIGFPLTTQVKDNPYYHRFEFRGKQQCLMVSQPRVLDAKRLIDRMGQLPEKQFRAVSEKVRHILG